MNKKLNTVIFLAAATIFNLVVMLVLLIGSLYLINQVAVGRVEDTGGGQTLIFALTFATFTGSVVLTFFLYNRLMKWLQAKFNLDNYLAPLFRRRPR